MARTSLPVVLRGESGTGKEVLARAVHRLSGRSGAFQAVNCAALAQSLAESELFGYRKGAFSGATEDRPGLIRSAQGGTLFLDEIGDLPLPLQGHFLRVLQESEVTPVGATRAVPVDFRLVAATHRDLEKMAAAGTFRADLLARIGGFTLELPPLRDRKEDLGMLIAALLHRHAGAAAEHVRFSLAAARALVHHDFRLNVRELEKALAVAVTLSEEGRIDVAHLPSGMPAKSDTAPPPQTLSPHAGARREQLIELLRTHKGNIAEVGRAVGKARMQIHRWMKRYGINPADFR
jgi:transcriptional regulator with PAS, ATPase and Fis domain